MYYTEFAVHNVIVMYWIAIHNSVLESKEYTEYRSPLGQILVCLKPIQGDEYRTIDAILVRYVIACPAQPFV